VFVESGLPLFSSWNATADGIQIESSVDYAVISGLVSGKYSWNVSSNVSPAPWTRFATTKLTGTVSVPSKSSVAVSYSMQYLVMFIASPSESGNVKPSNATWYAPGSQISISASKVIGYKFDFWNTTGISITIANQSSSKTTAVINGPGVIQANFESTIHGPMSGSNLSENDLQQYLALNTCDLSTASRNLKIQIEHYL
jgi:hypothetical protein